MIPIEVFEDVRFLEGIAESHRRGLASIAEVKDFPPGRVVFREGQHSSSVYLVLQGNVSLEVGVPGRGAVRVHTVGAGELLGWSPLLRPGPMTATARALRPSRLLAFAGPQVLALCAHDQALGMELMRRTALALAQHLDAIRLLLLDIYRDEMPAASGPGGLGEAATHSRADSR